MKFYYITFALLLFNIITVKAQPYQMTITFEKDANPTKYAVLYSYDTRKIDVKEIKDRKVQLSGNLTPNADMNYENGLVILTNKADYNNDDIKKGLLDPTRIPLLIEPNFSLTVNKAYNKSAPHGELNDVFFAFKKLEWKYSELWSEQVKKIAKLKKELSIVKTPEQIKIRQEELSEIKSNQLFVYPLELLKDNLKLMAMHKNSPIALVKLHGFAKLKMYPIQEINNSFLDFSMALKNSARGKQVKEAIDRRLSLEKEDLSVGDIAPAFIAKNMANKEVSLEDYKGQFVLLDFWTSWCGPCRAEMPLLKEVKENNKNLTIITVSFDENREKWKTAVSQEKILKFVNLVDIVGFKSSIAESYKIRSVPQNYLIDKTGKIIAKNIYGDELRKLLIEKKLAE